MARLYRYEKINQTICPKKRNPPFSALAGVWDIVWPAMHEELDVIQLSNTYVVSIGAHYTHATALLSKTAAIDYYTAQEVCCLLSYLFDSIVGVGVRIVPKRTGDVYSGLRPYLRLFGFKRLGRIRLQQQIIEPLDVLGGIEGGLYQRALPPSSRSRAFVMGVDLPQNTSIRNALFAYRQALVSVDPAGAILNYWRVLEATTSGPSDRNQLLARVFTAHLMPVWCYAFGSRRLFDIVPRYKRFLKSHYQRLSARYGSPANEAPKRVA